MRAVRVVGGGPAGVMAALAAMREGAPSTGRRGGRPFPNRWGGFSRRPVQPHPP
jgi:hypothetical protein